MTEWELKKKRRKARIDGICIDCFENEATVNKEGQSSVRCDECRGKIRQGERPEPKPTTVKPRVYDIDAPNAFDGKEFLTYCLDVAEMMKRIQGEQVAPVNQSLGLHKRTMGDKYIPEWHLVALDRLETAGEIVRTRDVLLSYWVYTGGVREAQPVQGFNGEKKALPWTDNNIIFGAKCA